MSDLPDAVMGARMAVDQEFGDRIAESEFSRQQWNLVMTAVEFEIEHADDPERASIVADTSKLPAVVPELEEADAQRTTMGAGRQSGSDGGFVDSVKDALGLGGDDDHEETRRAAESLAQEYAAELQAHLEAEGRWEEIRAAASDS